MKKITTLMTLLTALGAQDIVLEEVQVTAANNTQQSVKDATESIDVITSDMIEEAQVTTLTEALSQFGNIPFTSNGGLGKSTSLFLRGFDSKRILVLIDGIRYNDITGLSGAQFQHIVLADIERIEIIKGAQSGVWGADASAGVINIITKKAKRGTRTFFKASIGSYNTQEAVAKVSRRGEKYEFNLAASSLTSEGFSAAEPKQGTADYGKRGDELGYERDAYENQSYTLSLGYNVTSEDRLYATSKYIKAYTEYDCGAGKDAQNVEDCWGFGASNYFSNIDNRYNSLGYQHRGKVHQVEASYNLSDFNRDDSFTGNSTEYRLKDRMAYGKKDFVQFGWNFQEHSQKLSNGAVLDQSYKSNALFVSNYNKIGSLILSESLRSDSYDNYGDEVTGKVGIKKFFGQKYLAVNYGTAYSVPTLYQLYDSSYGNIALLPEETKGGEIAVGSDDLEVSFFYNEIDNLIEWSGTYQNIAGTSRLKGAEVSLKHRFSKQFRVKADYTYLDPRNSSGELLRRRPQHQVTLNATNYLTQSFSLVSKFQYIGSRYESNDEQGAQTGKYGLLDMTLNYESKKYNYFVQVNNITDRYYQVVDGYATAGRNVKAGLSARF